MKTGAAPPLDYLLNIKEIAELNYVKLEDNKIKIGAATPLSVLENHPLIHEHLLCLQEALKGMAAIAVRNMATLGGNLCNASPAGDTIPPLTVYGARLKLAKQDGTREVALEDFISGPGKNILAADELLQEVSIPVPPTGTGAAFIKKTRVKADISKINTAVLLTRVDETCREGRIAMGSVAAKVIRIPRAEALLSGQCVTADLIRQVAGVVADEIKPIDDIRSTAEYRRDIASVIVADALKLAWRRSGGVIND
jgi:carbon-monoxide dehydrogenase medium subunit